MSALALSDQQQQARERARQGIRERDRSQLEIGHDLLVAFPLGSRGHATGWSAFCAGVEADGGADLAAAVESLIPTRGLA